jgi:hypothetical protein
MEQPHAVISQQRRSFFVPVLRTLSSLGAVTGLGVFWVPALKRDPHAPLNLHWELSNQSYFWDVTLDIGGGTPCHVFYATLGFGHLAPEAMVGCGARNRITIFIAGQQIDILPAISRVSPAKIDQDDPRSHFIR